MVEPDAFLDSLHNQGIQFFTGVPDSLLKNMCACLSFRLPPMQHIIASNEGCALALAMGHYLATAQPALVYMQNSGLGNIVNPVTSLADPEVYAIPMLLLIGWRGEMLDSETQVPDEPQHRKQGKVTLHQLETLDIPYRILSGDTSDLDSLLKGLMDEAHARSGPVALVVRKNSFARYQAQALTQNPLWPTREQAIELVLLSTNSDAVVVSTTGKASREVFEMRKASQSGHHRDFLTVGGMGYASQIAAGIAIARPDKQVVCIDGDGAALMHLGGCATSADCANLLHVLINNEAHESVGGQPTKGNVLNYSQLAEDMGYRHCSRVDNLATLQETLNQLMASEGSRFVEVRCRVGSRAELGRPDRSPRENKSDFMQFLGASNDR
ncbi:MAG: phosphonopyruvate decarboxylase [Halieaceae bacterium]|jgi:phosphonopyruvate decarboxylase|nr:phosphonopyruvate decarboxylase [Halieaceae bacterium]